MFYVQRMQDAVTSAGRFRVFVGVHHFLSLPIVAALFLTEHARHDVLCVRNAPEKCLGLPSSTGMGMANSYIQVSIAGQQRKTSVKRGTGAIIFRDWRGVRLGASARRCFIRTPESSPLHHIPVNPTFNEQMEFTVLDHKNFRIQEEFVIVEAFYPGTQTASEHLVCK